MTRAELIEVMARASWDHDGYPADEWSTAVAEGWGYVEHLREEMSAALDALLDAVPWTVVWAPPLSPDGVDVGVWVKPGPMASRDECERVVRDHSLFDRASTARPAAVIVVEVGE